MSPESAEPTSADTPASQPTSAKPGKNKSASRELFEDLMVTAFGCLTSGAVAWSAWWIEVEWETAIYSWMVNFILPAGAILCGLVAAIGYWVGARLFNHKPSRLLLLNIVLVSLSTYFGIHHLHYSNDKIYGVAIEKRMAFGDYLVAVTENMRYTSSRSGSSNAEPTELGKWGWGVAALQVAGFALGGFIVYGMLASVPYCDACGQYLSEKSSCVRKGKDIATMRQQYARAAQFFEDGQLQAAIHEQQQHGDGSSFRCQSVSTIELRKCPSCTLRRLLFTLAEKNGNNFAVISKYETFTHEPLVVTA